MNAGTLEGARLRHPAGSRLRAGGPATMSARAVVPLRLVVPAERPPARCGGEPPRLRSQLTRRGRMVLLGLLLAVIFCLGLIFGSRASGTDSRPAPGPVRQEIVVQPGQTLWSIARAAAPHADPRVTVARIMDLNALPSARVESGRRLLLP